MFKHSMRNTAILCRKNYEELFTIFQPKISPIDILSSARLNNSSAKDFVKI